MSSKPDGFANVGPGKPSGSGAGVAIGGILVALLAFVFCCGLPVLLFLPAVGSAREAARRNGCLNNMRQLAIASANHESAQNAFPTASDGTSDLALAQTVGGHGGAAASSDGFSWIYHLLPYIEETILAQQMQNQLDADDAQTGPFDADFVNDAGDHFAATHIGAFRCPSYSGPLTVPVGDVDAALGNYCAIVGTDLAAGVAAPWKTTPNWENGGLPSACWATPNSQTDALAVGTCVSKGIGMRDLSDGISKTIIMVETRDDAFNAWISGAATWVVAASPNSLAKSGATVAQASDGWVAIMQNGETARADGVGLALNFGNHRAQPAADCYLQARDWATSLDRAWGPSSEHAGSVVIHAYADAHAQAIPMEIDPTAYLRFITRADGDPSEVDGLQ